LFNGDFTPAKIPSDTQGLIELVCRGGWPEAIDLPIADAQLVAREYLRLLFAENLSRQGKDSDNARRLVSSIARNLGQTITYKTILADMFGAGPDANGSMTPETLASYLDALKRLYLIEEVKGWAPPARSRKRIATRPKRYLADPSLAVAALGMSPESLMRDWQTFGLVFENLCVRDLMVYARALEEVGDEPIRYYRDDSGLEADAIVELADGRWAAFEFKVGESKVADSVKNLKRLREKISKNPQERSHPPEFMAIVVGVSEYARQIEEGVYVIPIRALGS
jgi:predicted AAA+ superfamily ATPase